MSHTKFSDYELKALLDDERNCVKLRKGIKHISLHPFYLNNVAAGIAETLNKIVSKYDKSLNGIILAYKKPRLQQSNGVIHNDKGYIFVDVEAEFYMFCPEESSCVRAIVNKTGSDHVGCLIHKAFNISVPRPTNQIDWKGKFVKVGDEILIKITYVDMFYIIPYIKGEIVEILLKSIKSEMDYDSGISTNEKHLKTAKKKSKSNKNDSFIDSNKFVKDVAVKSTLNVEPEKEISKKLRKSKNNSLNQETQISNESNIVNKDDTVKGKKSKKRRETINEMTPTVDDEVLEMESNYLLDKLMKKQDKLLKKIDGSSLLDILKHKDPFNGVEKSPKEIKSDSSKNAHAKLKVKEETNLTPVNSKKSKKRRNTISELTPSGDDVLDNSIITSNSTFKNKKDKHKDKTEVDLSTSKLKIKEEKHDTLNELSGKLKEKTDKLLKEIDASPLLKVKNSTLKNVNKVESPKKIKSDSLNEISKNIEVKLNEEPKQPNVINDNKLSKKIKTRRQTVSQLLPAESVSKEEKSQALKIEKKVESPKKIKSDSLNEIPKNVEVKLNGKEESKLSKKIKTRRQTVSELLPAESISKEEKKKQKKLNKSLDDNEILVEKSSIESADGGSSQKSKKRKLSINEIQDDIQALKNRLLASVLKECTPQKEDQSLPSNQSNSKPSRKRKNKDSIETPEMNENKNELTPQRNETLDESEDGLKKRKSKRKKINSPNEKYPSLQLNTPQYVDYVPTNDVSTFHDSISPIKMKDRPNLFSPETKKYTSPARSASKSRKSKSPTKKASSLADFHSSLISQYLKK